MANDFIKIERTQAAATEAAELLTWIKNLRQVIEVGDRILAKMKHNFISGGSISWAQLQTLWGVPSNGTDTGDDANGKIVYTYVDGTVGSLKGTFQTDAGLEVTERVG